MIKNILVVCIGNICRSPMAEAILKSEFANNPQISIRSAGLHALVNKPADPMAQALMAEKGIDISTHRAQQITNEMVLESELILTMSTEQELSIGKQFPNTRGKVYRLGKWDGYDILDPYRRPRVVFEQSLSLIEQSIENWKKMLWN